MVGGQTKKGMWGKLLRMAWQQVQMKETHVNVLGRRDVPRFSGMAHPGNSILSERATFYV